MNTVLEKVRREPVLVTALVQAVLALVVSFGLSLSPEQIGGILAVTAAVLAFVARSKTVPAREVEYVEADEEPEPLDDSDEAWA